MAGKAALRVFQKSWRSASSRATRTSLAAAPARTARRPRRSAPRTRPAAPSSSTSSAAPASSGQPAWAIGLGGADRQVVHHLDRARHDARPRRCPTPPARRARVESKNATSVRTDSGVGTTRSDDLRGHAQRALGADERAAAGRSPGRSSSLPPSCTTVAVGQHDLQAGHVVGREAVLEAVRAAGVLGHVAADRADDLARRVGRVEVRRARPRPRRRRSSRPARTHDALVVEVDLEDAPQPRERRRARRPRPAAPRPTGPLPEPRATHGTPAAWQARTTAATSSRRAGQHGGRGTAAYCSSPSDS